MISDLCLNEFNDLAAWFSIAEFTEQSQCNFRPHPQLIVLDRFGGRPAHPRLGALDRCLGMPAYPQILVLD